MLFSLTLYAQQVLGYSALQFGLTSAVMTVMSIGGAFAGQAMVTKVGLRPVAVSAMVLIVAGSLLLTSVSVGGTFFGDMFWGLLVFGPGMGAAFAACQIAALTGVAQEESGLAAGLVDTLFNIGTALGIATSTTVVVSVSAGVLAGGRGVDPTFALTDGVRSAFLAAAVIAGLGMIAALRFPGRVRPADGSTKPEVVLTKG